MKRVLAFLLGIGRKIVLAADETVHDDSLRANQGQDRAQSFSFWRALVS
jgi:hypothetical protein